jgi:hypothetical protein
MKKKLLLALLAVSTFVVLIFSWVEFMVEPPGTRAPASPSNYDGLGACQKQDLLWEKVKATSYQELPDFRKFGALELLALSRQEIALKGRHPSDFAPQGWKKLIHGRGALAKVKIVPRNQRYTGIFQGADCALLRLSITFKPSGNKPVAPGLALKVLRDGAGSANISALVSLSGQEKDFNFFKFPLSNIVPTGHDFGQKIVHKIFSKVSGSPEELLANDMAKIDSHGQASREIVAPRQLFFVPQEGLKFASEEHDVRKDFLTIPAQTTIYRIHAASERERGFDYANYTPETAATFLKDSDYIADVVTTSEFIASEFGDDGIFFRHELKP